MKSLIFFIIYLYSCIGFSQTSYFDKIGKKNGLPDNNIFDIKQDTYGHLWFGTSNGLAIYNGYTFKVWRHIQGDTTSIQSNQVDYLLTLPNGELYIGHINKGFYKFDYHHETFQALDHSKVKPNKKWLCAYYSQHEKIWIGSGEGLEYYDQENQVLKKVNLRLSDSYSVSSISEDDRGFLWLFCSKNRIIKYHPESGSTEVISFGTKIYDDILTRGGKILYDRAGYVWIGTEHEGLYRYNIRTKTFTNFSTENGKFKSNIVLCLQKDKKGSVWIGTDAGGLYEFPKPTEDTPRKYLNDPKSEESISSNTVYSILEVEPELLLLGTFAGGLNVINEFRHKFTIYTNKGLEGKCLSHKSVLSFAEENVNQIWIGTDGGGLDLFDTKTQSYSYLTQENGKLPHSNVAKCLLKDSQSRLWVGSYAGGVAVFDKNGKLLKIFNSREVKNKIGSDHVWRIEEDNHHQIWLGLLNNGVERISSDLNTIDHFTFDLANNSGLRSREVIMIKKDNQGKIWALAETLHYFDYAKNHFVEYKHAGINLPANLRDICVDKMGNLWVASSDASFFKIPSNKNEKPVIYLNASGWFGNAVFSIQDDEFGNIWLATDIGISCLKTDGEFLNFDLHDGVQTGQFNSGAKLRDKAGYIYFGGSEGYHRFHPKNIKLNYHLPTVSISDIRIFNQPLSSFPKYKKSESVFWNDSTIYFDYTDKMISIEFAGLDFVSPEKNRFSYILEGFDEDWNFSRSGTHIATYTNLDPGKYVFKVKAANNDGKWNTINSQLYIIISPPWWVTWWFRTLVVLSIIIGFYFWRTRSIRQRNLELHWEVAAQTNELRQINEELQQTSEEVSRQNKEIHKIYDELSDSIHAAEVIQKAILPGKDLLEEYFGSIEIFYKPKDVVSGDFYWCAKIGNRYLIAVVDCTGHGVAGAFMTFIAYETLNQVLREHNNLNAGQIISHLNQEILLSMNRYQSGKVNAGMDVSLCILDKDKNIVEFAGANNPLYIVRANEIIVHKGDKQGIGGKQKSENYQFQTHFVSPQLGDQLYIFSDGFADQIGGESRNEKYMYPRFREKLLRIKDLKIHKRLSSLEIDFENWRNGYEQLDDVLVIGFEIK